MAAPRIIFRADASASIGSGHVMRCLTLAERLATRGADVIFASRESKGDLIAETERRGYRVLRLSPPGPGEAVTEEADAGAFALALDRLAPIAGTRVADWIIVDHYQLSSIWQDLVRSRTTSLLAIDDLADRRHRADVLLDQNLVQDLASRYDGIVEDDCLKLLGPRYALLARNYANLRSTVNRTAGLPSKILVYFGGADTRLTLLAANALAGMPQAFSATIVLDEGNDQYEVVKSLVAANTRLKLVGRLPDLASAMVASDLFVGASGTTSWERLSLGLYAIVVTLADNQVPLARELAARDFIDWLGDAKTVTLDRLAAAITRAMAVPTVPEREQAMMDIVDGQGAERVGDVLLIDRQADVNMRPVWAEDSEMVLAWANDPGTRRYAFSTGTISRDVHTKWFAKRLDNADVVFLIAETPNGVALGQVRFERQADGSWEISYLLAPIFRGRGLARKILASAIDTLAKAHPAPMVTGLAKPENTASMHIFSALGFVSTPSSTHEDAIRFVLDLGRAVSP